ncbi:uncharacterized protein LOC121858354 [Homarus americanus]|uniref:Uncharacterized protein n=1 Tax=Homarus americanus TaxID=6706 RepID=A0A8J5N993_HOMAM|nr:uncharacterized protein LOC121858354 [Homarus americanus]XP_042210721.1 uncharacterized protein LOC121858354 [Homarus americanus]KAG7175417.1 hypothetical protein Hamer_G001504 [Homarus americanus]
MKRTLLLLVLVVGAALAEEEHQEEPRTAEVINTLNTVKLVKTTLFGPLGSIIEISAGIVVLIALVLLIVTLKKSTGDVFGGSSSPDYEYYSFPAGGYETSGGDGGSSYTGYQKRSVDTPSFMDLPIVQRLTERVHNAIDNFKY